VQQALWTGWCDLPGMRDPTRLDAWLYDLPGVIDADEITDGNALEHAFAGLSTEHRAVVVLHATTSASASMRSRRSWAFPPGLRDRVSITRSGRNHMSVAMPVATGGTAFVVTGTTPTTQASTISAGRRST
jgi:hypothetical protein